jgi:hypothetical protein
MRRVLSGEDVSPSEYYFRTTPRFETGDERYAWLTRIQAVGKSVFDGTKLEYEIFEVA